MRGGGPKPSFCGADLAQPVVENKKAQRRLGFFVLESQGNSGRGERIRTSGLYVPNVALYQAKLHPEFNSLCRYTANIPSISAASSSKIAILAAIVSKWNREMQKIATRGGLRLAGRRVGAKFQQAFLINGLGKRSEGRGRRVRFALRAFERVIERA
jgi:hypothetical protein